MRHFGGYVFLLVFLLFADGQNDIRMPPYITKGPMESVIFRDDSAVTLECRGEGVPAVTYEWKKNGADLNLNAPNIKRGIDGTIIIQPAGSYDVGHYQCFVVNRFGTALSVTSNLQKAFLDSSVGTLTVANLTVREGEPFHIQYQTRRSFPSATYAWEMATDTVDRSPLPYAPSPRVQIADNGDLYFAYATLDDEFSTRIYKSTTYNQYLDIKASGSFTRVTITRGAQTLFAPTLAFTSALMTVGLIGKQVSLRCFFSGNPTPEITWRGPRNILPSDRCTKEKFNSELIIRNITASDEGDYTCIGRNSKGEYSHTLQLKVEAKPAFKRLTDGPQNTNVTDGGEAVFHCNAEAIPGAMVVWLQDGKAIDVNSPPPKFAFSNGGKTLTVRSVCRTCDGDGRKTDLTVIQCNASNIHGYAFASGYLNVLAKIRIISKEREYVSVDVKEKYSLNFDCDVTFDPSTPPTVRWHKVKYGSWNELELVHPTPELVLKPVKDNPSVTLSITVPANRKDLWSKYQGEYRCIADIGYSSATKVVVLRVKEDHVEPDPDPEIRGKSRWSLVVVISIAGTLIVLGLLVYGFARLHEKRVRRNNLEYERESRRRAAGVGYSTLSVDRPNATQCDDHSTINHSSPNPHPPPYAAAIQSPYLTTTNDPPRKEFTPTYYPAIKGIYDEPVGDAQTGNTASSRYCNELQETHK